MDRAPMRKQQRGVAPVRRTSAMQRAGQTVARRRVSQVLEKLESRQLLAGQAATVGNAPALFVQNQGQWADEISYALRTGTANILMTDSGPVFAGKLAGSDEWASFAVSFDGARTVDPRGVGKSSTKFNFFVGDSSQWASNVDGFSKIAYRSLYRGVDLYTWAQGQGLKYEFHVAPGANSDPIKISYTGAEPLSIDSKGRLHVKTELGELVDDAPLVYQTINGQRVVVQSAFKLVDQNTYTFDIKGSYDPSRELIIDPELSWATFIGGGQGDAANAVAVDSEGTSYVTGQTGSNDLQVFPTGVAENFAHGQDDIFVGKYDVTGQPAWINYFGGSDDDAGRGIAVDSTGIVYVVGGTASDENSFTLLNGLNGSSQGNDDFPAHWDPKLRIPRGQVVAAASIVSPKY